MLDGGQDAGDVAPARQDTTPEARPPADASLVIVKERRKRQTRETRPASISRRDDRLGSDHFLNYLKPNGSNGL